MYAQLIIDREKLDQNVDVVRDQVGTHCQIMAVVKDNAYGHGMTEVATRIQKQVQWFCVAWVKEGIELRKAGITHPILVFEAIKDVNLSAYITYGLTAQVSHPSDMERLLPGTQVHLNIDTGMHRLGLLPSDVEAILQKIREYPQVQVNGIYTHFANSEDPNNSRVTWQHDRFKDIRAQFPSEWMTHTANSGAIFHYQKEDLYYDGVRPGVCLFGYAPGIEPVPALKPIMTWKTRFVSIKPISKGEKVSYTSSWQAPHDGCIGVIPSGYGSGIPRSIANKGHVMINGKSYPMVGNITMDYTMVFLGEHPVKGEDDVWLFTEEYGAEEWARYSETIPYEITTRLPAAIKRTYL
ncbi:MAG: alanine racemase [Bacteroidota bacterium]